MGINNKLLYALKKENKENYHIMAHPKGGWCAKRHGRRKASRRFNTRAKVIDWLITVKSCGVVVLHWKDGRVQRYIGWAANEVECFCGNIWVAVSLEGIKQFSCPECESTNNVHVERIKVNQ